MSAWIRAYVPKIVSGLAIAAVAGVAGVISYTHIYELTLALHQTVMVARLMPFGVDGLIVVGSVVLLQAIPGQWWLGWLGVGPGVAISLFANVESGIRYGVLAAIWAGIPAVAFSLATFMLERWLKAQASQASTAVPGVPAAVPVSQPEPEPVPDPYPDEPEPPSADAEFDRLIEWLTSGSNAVPGVPVTAAELNGHAHQAAELFADDLAAGRVPGIRAIRTGLHVGQDKASQVQAYLRSITRTQ